MKLSDIKDEKALDLLADIIEPAIEIMSDNEIRNAYEDKSSIPKIVKILIKKHKKSIIEILAVLDGVPVEEYHINVLTLPTKLIEILSDDVLMDFFSSQAQTTLEQRFSSATESTEEVNK